MSNTQNAPAKKQPDSIEVMLAANWKTLQRVVPEHLTAERMAGIAHTAITRNPDLLACSQLSLINAVIESSTLGLEIGGPLALAHLIPFNNRKSGRKEAQLIIGYQGYRELAFRSEHVLSFPSHPVYENDHFEYSYGLHPRLEHRPAMKNRGALAYAYAICHMVGGGFDFEVVTPEDIEATKKKSAGYMSGKKDSPWNIPDQEWTMWCKTAVRILAKRVPKSPALQRAAALEERADAGLDQGLAHIIDVQPMQSDPDAAIKEAAALARAEKPATKNEPQPEPEQIDCPIDLDLDGNPQKVFVTVCEGKDCQKTCPQWEGK